MRCTKVFVICFLVSVWSGGCTPWVMRAPGVDGQQAAPTLVASAIVWVQPPGCDPYGNCQKQGKDLTTVASIAAGLIDNSTLGEFGLEMISLVDPTMKKYGFALEWDEARAKKIDNLEIFTISNDVTVLTGYWSHPQTSQHKFVHNYFTNESALKAISQALAANKDQEHFVCFYLSIGEEGWIFEEPLLDLNIMVINQEGKEIFAARAIGEGDSSFWVVDKSPANLKIALLDAIKQLEGAEVEPLE